MKHQLEGQKKVLVDVRGTKEYYTGEILVPPGYPTEHAQREAHIQPEQ